MEKVEKVVKEMDDVDPTATQQRARLFIDQSHFYIGYITDNFLFISQCFSNIKYMYFLCKLCNISRMIVNDLFVYKLEFLED